MQSALLSSIVQASSVDPPTADGPSPNVANDFLVPGCICEIAASENSTDTVWFVKIFESSEADQPYTDDYSFTSAKGQKIFSGKYMEQAETSFHLFKISFQEMKKTMFFYKTSLFYPFVNYCDIILYVEHFCMMPL